MSQLESNKEQEIEQQQEQNVEVPTPEVAAEAAEPVSEPEPVQNEEVIEPATEEIQAEEVSAPEENEVTQEEPIAEEVSTPEVAAEVTEPVAEIVQKEEEVEPVTEEIQAEEAPVQEISKPEEIEVVEEKPVVEENKTSAIVNYDLFTRQELVDSLKALLDKDISEIRGEVEIIKQCFYKKLKAENESAKQEFLAAGGEEQDFHPEKDELENVLKNLLNEYKNRKTAHNALVEKERENNLLQKEHILEQMKALSESTDDVSSSINEFKTLQQKWRTIGQVPAASNTEIWKRYNMFQEQFWDLVKINNEMREYDFRKNFEAKILLIQAAEKLVDEQNVVSAFQQLQKLHDEWHDLGPVSREMREEIWARFREASTAINKKHQGYFETLRKNEDENLKLKTDLCEKIENFDFSNIAAFKQWDEATQTVIGWQEEWKKIGFASRKHNTKIFDRFRKACDAFFSKKSEFYKEVKGSLSENLARKIALCEKAEALKDNTEWKETSEQFVQLQKEWKTIGQVPKKDSNEVWKRFLAACDFFFEQKNANMKSHYNEENENLAKKKDIIAQLDALEYSEKPEETVAKIKGLIAEWNDIGFVPFKEKDKIFKQFRAIVDKHFDTLHVDASQRRIENYKNSIKELSKKGEDKVVRERERLMRTYEHLSGELSTYENNIGFLTSSSKSGGGLIKEMEKKIQSLKNEKQLIEQKIKLLDEGV
jgi:Tfp pilus assembly protein FimV